MTYQEGGDTDELELGAGHGVRHAVAVVFKCVVFNSVCEKECVCDMGMERDRDVRERVCV